jgi:hypothetical protein
MYPKRIAAFTIAAFLMISSTDSLAQTGFERWARSPEGQKKLIKRFPQVDKDGDGRLSGKEIESIKSMRKKRAERKNRENGREPGKLEAINTAGKRATYSNMKYGDHASNVFDIWLAESDKPTPLVIFIHGGGFRGGDKSKAYRDGAIVEYLDAGVSFATINYRFRDQDPRGVMACMLDSARCLQYIRSRAKEWNIDKERVGCYGGSAGAGTSLWIGFHDEMADPGSDDPVLRESTRISVVGANGTQATYDMMQWRDILGLRLSEEEERAALQRLADLYKVDSVEALHSPEVLKRRKEYDMLGMMDKDDPPFYAENNMKGGVPEAGDKGHINHHPLHCVALLKRAEEVGLRDCHIEARALAVKHGKHSEETMVEFFLRHLVAEK